MERAPGGSGRHAPRLTSSLLAQRNPAKEIVIKPDLQLRDGVLAHIKAKSAGDIDDRDDRGNAVFDLAAGDVDGVGLGLAIGAEAVVGGEAVVAPKACLTT